MIIDPPTQSTRLYGLFRRPAGAKRGARWQRVFPDAAYPKGPATRIFQTALLNYAQDPSWTASLRPVPQRG